MTASTNPLECFVATARGHRVRVRLLGRGPALVMCHESPRSSAALLPLAERLADRFTCIMLDTPGFGLTDALPLTRPEIPDYAAVVLAVTERLGLDKATYYGTHTGAAIVIELALQAPSRVSAVLLDGYALFNETERDELLSAYLTPIKTSLDGTHVAWLWSRVRDQFTAFPWHRVGDAGRLGFGPPSIDFMQSVVRDFLLAGDHYRAGYAAAFRYDHLAPIQKIQVPVYLAARTDDLLFGHLQNATGLSASVEIEHLSADRDVWGMRIGDLLYKHASVQATLDAGTMLEQLSGIDMHKHIANTSVGPVVMRFDGPLSADPVILLHDTPGDMCSLDSVAEHLVEQHRVIRLDLPGMSTSALNHGIEPTVEHIVRGVKEAILSVEAAGAPVVAFGASLPVALGIGDSRKLLPVDPWPQNNATAGLLPELTPRWDGAHLFAAFYWARDYELYKPWYHRNNAEGRKLGGERDEQQLHQRYRAGVLGGEQGIRAARALYNCDCRNQLQAAARQTSVLLYADDPDVNALQSWAGECVDSAAVQLVSRDARQLAASISEVLDA